MEGKSNFVRHCEVNSLVKFKIGSLEGTLSGPGHEKLLERPILKFAGLSDHATNAQLKVTLELHSEGQPISLPVSTCYKSFRNRCVWNEWITIPLRYSDLPQGASICFTIYDCGGPATLVPLGGGSISVFGKHGFVRQGTMDLRVWRGQVADGNNPSATPGKGSKDSRITLLNKLTKKHRAGQLVKVDWLDRLTFSEIEMICEREKRDSDFMFLNVEFPAAEITNIPYVIGYEEENEAKLNSPSLSDSQWFPDHEILLDNLVEVKHHTLSRCIHTGLSERELKPNPTVRDHLAAIVSYPPTKQLSAEEQDSIWKFRYYLSSNKKALGKFLKCVKWGIQVEEKEALELLRKWAPMDVQDALELLGPQFRHQDVRSYAVARLKQAPDEDLLLYLLQLVQALKYENLAVVVGDSGSSNVQASSESYDGKSDSLGSSFKIEEGDCLDGKVSPSLAHGLYDSGSSSVSEQLGVQGLSHGTRERFQKEVDQEGTDLTSFLIYRVCENTTLVNYFYWYLFIECEDHEVGVRQDLTIREMYGSVMKRFIKTLKRGPPEWQQRRDLLSRQQKLIGRLVEIVRIVARESSNRPRKIEKLQALLSESDLLKMNLSKFDPFPFPLDPEVHIHGILAKEATLFKSSQMPCKLYFLTTTGESYMAIFKHGDDLRQDQLVLQIITLMDKLLRKENLDLKLTPYRVLATSTTHGFVQFIHSTTVADVLGSEGTIQNFFRRLHPSDGDLYGILPSVMDTYVKSCAGYCVITYLLGVGDRHLDNLLLTPGGKLFHIDFGYILGRDPKPMPPPMKLSKEMVEAMGGIHSEYYQEFRKLCYTAFLHLRRHANLILNLFSLMVGASVPDIALEPDKTVKKVLDKFQLELDDESAVKYMQEVIDISVSAVMPALLEQVHKFTQMLRK